MSEQEQRSGDPQVQPRSAMAGQTLPAPAVAPTSSEHQPAPTSSEPAPAPASDGPEPPVSLASPELADRAGAVMSRPEVLEARAAAVAARETFSSELSTLKTTARATFDPRVRIPEAAQDIAEDPKRALGIAAAVGGGLFGLRFLRGRKAKAPTILPTEVADTLAGMGKDGEAVKAALDRSFTRYLQEHGAAPAKRRRLPPGMNLVILPIAGQIGREVVRQAFKRRDETAAGGPAGPSAGPTGAPPSAGEDGPTR